MEAGLGGIIRNTPVVTRLWIFLVIGTTTLTKLGFIDHLDLYFNYGLIFRRYQFWRLITCFLYIAPFGVNFLFQVILLYMTCRRLEEGSYPGRSVDFMFVIIIAGILNLVLAPFFKVFFLGIPLSFTLGYLWARRFPMVHMSIYGVLRFRAKYLPWVRVALSFLMGFSAYPDFMGIVSGHIIFFFLDCLPELVGKNILKTPNFFRRIFGQLPDNQGFDPIFQEIIQNNEQENQIEIENENENQFENENNSDNEEEEEEEEIVL
ncbi:der1-like protein derlin [Anaeramoeba flamelloides]|uniref:Derlin n=1 Tax=Anaeramoeba flamelloides TaxID=1746091 RepID=A0AAV7Z0P0_9EUKA|nr:der1-like protein derlin [Anaeramoeba flamelloides]